MTKAAIPLALLLTLIAGQSRADVKGGDLFRSEIAGVELTKPDGWVFQNLQTIANHRANVMLKDREFQEAIQQMAAAPLVVATKHPEPYESLNPVVQLLVRPLGQLEGASGVEILELVVPTLANAFEGFELIGEISEIQVGGLPAGRLIAEYTVAALDGTTYDTRATMVAVPNGSFLYQFGFSGPPEGPDAMTDEVDFVLSSVRFLEQGE